jgi:hypothetical protein
MTAGTTHPDAWHDRPVFVDELQHSGLGQRDVIILQIAAAVACVRMCCVFPLAAADDVLGARKPGLDRSIGRPSGEATGVVEMQVRGEDDVDVVDRETRFTSV